jgi:hypothetical protein
MHRVIEPKQIESAWPRLQWAIIIFLSAIVIAIGVHGVGLGLGHDWDARAILDYSVPLILKGSYGPGRSFGNPLYEFIAAWQYMTGGIVLANSYSIVLAIASIGVFHHLLGRTDGWSRAFALIGFCLSPVFLTNAYAFGEWMQTFFFTLCLLWAAARWLETSSYRDLMLYAAFSALLVLTRPDAAFICFGVFIALLWQLNLQPRRSLELFIASAIAGAATAAIIVVINHGLGFLNQDMLGHNNTWLRSVIIATLGVCTLFGFPGVVVVLGCAAFLIRRTRGVSGDTLTFWGKLFLVGIVLGFGRYTLLPEKLEYVFYLLVLTLLMMIHEKIPKLWIALLALSAIMPTFFAMSLFQRMGADDQLYLRPHFDRSAILQDWTTSQADWDIMDAQFLEKIAREVYVGDQEKEPLPRLFTTTFGPGLLSDKGDLLIGAPEAYKLDNPRSGDQFMRSNYRRIYICDKSMFHGSRGWRLLQKPVPRPAVDPETGRVDVRCALEGSASGKER